MTSPRLMRYPIALAVIIAAAALGLGWHDARQFATVRTTHGQLVAEAAQLGLTLDPLHPDKPVRVTKREREDRAASAKRMSVEFISFAREMEAVSQSGKPMDEAMQKRMMEAMDRLMSLDAIQMKILIAEVRATTDLKDETRQGLIGFSLMTLANDHPQAALAMFIESSDLLKGGMGQHVISTSLARWATDDPQAALEWVRKNGASYPEAVTDEAKRGLLTGAAIQDPKLAFQLIGELGFKDANGSNNAILNIVSAAKTPEARTAMLAALHDHLATLTDDKARADVARMGVSALVQNVAQEGFESASKWLATSSLTPAELAGFAESFNPSSAKSGETGQWVAWIGDTLPADKADQKINSLVSNWTRTDYQAAGQWLAAAPDGPAKNSSVRAYAETVSRYEPEVAAQWALTLPAGKSREDTLRHVYHNWPKSDPAASAAAAAFAQQHGIK